ncbi:MAG: CopG family transcriptional regulator [Candidatus Heimdallarchaeota archaeon]
MYEEAKMEKLTINLPPVEIGRVDILVEAGYYPSRTEFIRAAIRKTLDSHQAFIDSKIDEQREEIKVAEADHKKYSSTLFGMGVISINKKTFERALSQSKKVKIHVIGMLNLERDITPELIEETVDTIKVYGVLRASKEVKDALQKIKRKDKV